MKSIVGLLGRHGLNVGVAFAVAIAAATVTTSALADRTFILAHPMTTDHINHTTSETFIKKLGELSGGKLNVEYHPGGDLGDWVVQFEQVMQGALPMSMTWLASDFDKRLDIAYLAYVVDNWKDGTRVYGPGGPMIEVYNDLLEPLNVKLLVTLPTDFGSIAIRKGVGKKPVMFPGDASGIKIRVPPLAIGVKRFEAWGFSPVPIPFSELYTALQLGTVDARSFGPPVEIWQMRDVLETYILTRDYFEHAFWMVNKDWWDGLSKDERGWIQAAADHAAADAWRDAEALGQSFIEKVKDYGINVIELTPEQRAAAKNLVYEHEWPWMEERVGKELMDKIKNAAGVTGQ